MLKTEKKNLSSDFLNYVDIMRELNKQKRKKIITIKVVDQTYNIKNSYYENAYKLSDKLANQIYGSIRKFDIDIYNLADNLSFKADNIKNVKDHVFYNKHILDRYGPDQTEYKRFNSNLQQALA